MDDKTTKLILKKGKKYKKWTEGMGVNPFYWVENGNPYYVVIYMGGTKSTASAFFTTGKENKEDALRAHPPLATFSELSTNIFDYGAKRADVGMGYYTKLMAIPFHSTDEQAAEGREAFAELSKYQDEYNELFKEFTHYYDHDVLVREKLEESDIVKVQETVVKADLLQYRIGTALQKHGKDIVKFVEYLESREEWEKLDRSNQIFIKEITKNMSKAKKELDDLNLIIDEDPERMFQLNYDKLVEDIKKSMANQRKNIRYPK